MAKKEFITIYHNPRCGKSRAALKVLQESGKDITIVEYLKHPLSVGEIKKLVKKLNMSPSAIIREKELIYKENYAGKLLTDEDYIEAIATHPILMERPIVEIGEKAWIIRSDYALNHLKQLLTQ
jgi:arsenate reductase